MNREPTVTVASEGDANIVEEALELIDDIPILDDLLKEPGDRKAAFRKRNSNVNKRSVHPADLDEMLAKDWQLVRTGKRQVRIKREKPLAQKLEDRAWCLLYLMGYEELNAQRFNMRFKRESGSTGSKQIDAFGCDDETAIIIECKSKMERGRKGLAKDIAETHALQNYIRATINRHYQDRAKPKLIWLYVTHNIIWSEPDVERARDAGIYIVTENELQYFETFLKHMGPAGRYQILGEFLKDQKIPAMQGHKVPAIRGTLGGNKFYSFVTTPRILLKIAFVNHQALNHPDGRPAYQRMISSRRIKDIGDFISQKGGFFPTNLLINFTQSPQFSLLSNKENIDPNTKFGWLTLPAVYRSAWIIDGQHRLYGYSGLADAFLDQALFVLAFDKMSTFKEADLFITINHKQKSVQKSLLDALLADLRMGDDDPKTAIRALASSVVRRINTDKTSPLGQRFAMPDVPPALGQNLTVSEAINGLTRSGLIGKMPQGVRIAGPLCGATDDDTVERARNVLNGYFEALRTANPKRWEAGKSAYMCVNPGIRAHLMLIPEIISYLSHRKGSDFASIGEAQFIEQITAFIQPICEYFRAASDDDVKENYARKFGEGGVKEYLYNLCGLIKKDFDDFGSDDFRRYVEQKESDAVDEANRFIMKLSENMMDCVVNVLKARYGTHAMPSGEPAYWEQGVTSPRVLKNAFQKQLEDTQDRRKRKEAYLDVIDLKDIIEQANNWPHFEATFSIPLPNERKGSRKYHTGWIGRFKEIRNIAAHKNKLRTYTDEDLEFVDWLRAEVAPRIEAEMERL